MPMYYNWFIFEGYMNRFSFYVKWTYILYFGAFLGIIGTGERVFSSIMSP